MDPNVRYFHECLIEFITNGIRLSTWHWTKTWNRFHAEFQCPAYDALTPVQLKDVFARDVLRNVFTYNLPVEQREKIIRLETYQVCGPKVTRTESGYVVAENIQRQDDDEIAGDPEFPSFEAGTANPDKNAFVLMKSKDYDEMMMKIGGDISIRCCVSTSVQNEQERLQESLLTWHDIQTRWANGHAIATIKEFNEDIRFYDKINRTIRQHFQRKLDNQRRLQTSSALLRSTSRTQPGPSGASLPSPLASSSVIQAQSIVQSTPSSSTTPVETSSMESSSIVISGQQDRTIHSSSRGPLSPIAESPGEAQNFPILSKEMQSTPISTEKGIGIAKEGRSIPLSSEAIAKGLKRKQSTLSSSGGISGRKKLLLGDPSTSSSSLDRS